MRREPETNACQFSTIAVELTDQTFADLSNTYAT